MKFSEIANRVTGLSCPVFGVQWTPAILDRDVARKALIFLEDRRVLYSPYEAEFPEYAVRSAIDIRARLTEFLDAGGIGEELADELRAMRVAARKFVEQCGRSDGQRILLPSNMEMVNGGSSSWVFNQALGEMRGAFGIHVARIAVSHGVDVPDELAPILPLAPEQDLDGLAVVEPTR